MAFWKNITRLGNSGPVQGVKNPEPLDVITPLQGVQITDDATWAVAPPAVPHGLIQGLMIPGVGFNSGLEIIAGGRGVWIKDAWLETAGVFDRSMVIWQDNNQAIGGLRGVQLPFVAGVVPGTTTETQFFAVQIATAAIPPRGTAAGRTDFGVEVGQVVPLNLFLPVGMRVFIANLQGNELDTVVYTFREVPSFNRADSA